MDFKKTFRTLRGAEKPTTASNRVNPSQQIPYASKLPDRSIYLEVNQTKPKLHLKHISA